MRQDTIHHMQKELQPAELTIHSFPARQLRFTSTSPLSEAAFTDEQLDKIQQVKQEVVRAYTDQILMNLMKAAAAA